MRRGEIWQVDLDPARGSEANNQRPAVVVSNDRANATATRLGRGVITVVPVTSNIAKVYPFQVLLSATTTGPRSTARRRPSKSDRLLPSGCSGQSAEFQPPNLPSSMRL